MAHAEGLVKLHSLTSEMGFKLNGTTGRLGGWHENHNGQIGNNRYEVLVGRRAYMIKPGNMHAVNPQWVAEVRQSPMRKRIQDMIDKFEAPGVYPCAITELQVLPRHYGGRGTNRQLVESWWGANVWRYIRQEMEKQRRRKGHANWEMDNAIQQGTLMLAGVRSDGGHHMQEHPSPTHTNGQFVMVWLTIVFLRDVSGRGDLRMSCCWYSYCQGLALQDGASPWVANSDALEFYGRYEAIVEVPHEIPSTVQITEVQCDSDMRNAEAAASKAHMACHNPHDWVEILETGQKSYYWNRRTGKTCHIVVATI